MYENSGGGGGGGGGSFVDNKVCSEIFFYFFNGNYVNCYLYAKCLICMYMVECNPECFFSNPQVVEIVLITNSL